MSRSLRVVVSALGAFVLAGHLAVAGCGAGGGGGGAYTRVAFANIDPSAAITELEFDFFVLSGIPNRVESVFVPPGFAVAFDFQQFESDNFTDVTITWSDATTTSLPLLLVSGGEFTFPVAR